MGHKDSDFINLSNQENAGEFVTGIQNQINKLEKEKEIIEDVVKDSEKDGDALSLAIYRVELRQIDRLIKVLKVLDNGI